MEVKGQGSPITVFPDRFAIGPLTVTKEGKITTWSTPFTFSTGLVSHSGQMGLATYPFDFSSLKASFSGRGKTEIEGETLSVSVSQISEMGIEIRPIRLAVVPVIVFAIVQAPQAVQGIIQRIEQVPVLP